MARSKGVVVQISAEDNSARAFESVNAQVAALRQQVSDLRSKVSGGGPGEDLARGMGHAVPEIAAASGAIREFEGNLPIRAVERFLTTTLGLGPVLAAAFPVVGAIALAGVVGEGIKKLISIGQEGAKAGEQISKGFRDINGELQRSNAELAVTDDKLEDEIAKLEKHPSNGLQTGLDEANAAALQLGKTLDADAEKVAQLFEKNKVTWYHSLVSGAGETEDTANLVLDRKKRIDDTRTSYDATVAQARETGDPANVKQAETARLVALQKAYAESDAALANAQAAAQRAQDVRNSPASAFGAGVSEKASGVTYASDKDNTANLNILAGARQMLLAEQTQIGLDARKGADEQKKAALDSARAQEDLAKKAAEQARKLQDAREKEAAAWRSLQDAEMKAAASSQKAADDQALAELESRHKALLMSDREFNEQRDALKQKTISGQRTSNAGQIDDVYGQYKSLVAEPLPTEPVLRVERETKLLELKTKIAELDARDAELGAASAKSAQERADAETERLRAKRAAEDSAAAQLEVTRGGGVSARQKQADDEYTMRRQQAIALGVDEPTLGAMDAQHTVDRDGIAAQGAEQTYGAVEAGLSASRAGVNEDESRGRISNLAAQQEKIALDSEEAAALEPVLAAYQKLASEGDLAATEKVAQLKQQISELKDPINEAALEVRTQLDSAFESLFENMDKGKKAWKSFTETIEKDALKDSYKQLIEPLLQTGVGMLIPGAGAGGASGVPSASKGGASSALGGLFHALMPGVPGLSGSVKAGGAPVVQIINQTSQPAQGTATSGQGDSSGITEALTPHVIQIVLENLESNGQIGQALAGLGGLAL